MDLKYILISIYLILISAITDFATYGISTAIFSGEYNTQSVFGNTKNALTISQILGYLVGKFIGMRIFACIRKEHRIYCLMIIYVLGIIPLIIFGLLPPVGQVIMFFLSSVPMVLFWGFLVFYIEGRNSTVIIIMIVYMALIMASGVAKTVGTLIMNGGVSENWMPAICASVSAIICAISSYLLYLSPAPTDSEQIDRQNRDCVDLDKQNNFYDKYKLPLTSIIIAYGLLTSYRNFRDYYALELWQELISNNFDPNVYSISEIIVSVVVTGLYCAIIFIKSEKNSFFTLLGLMLLSGLLITLTTIIYQFNHYQPIVWIIAVGISVYIGYVPPGALLYDKLMGATGVSMTSVNTIYISEFTATSTTLLVILLKITAFNTMSYVNYFIWLSYFVGVIVSILITISFISFWRLIR